MSANTMARPMPLRMYHFQWQAARWFFLTGQAGSGKTALLKLLWMMEKPAQGHIFLNKQSLTRLSIRKRQKLRHTLGVVMQSPKLLATHTVYHQVALPLVIAGYRPKAINQQVHEALESVQLLNKAQHGPQGLSASELQRVGIARAIVHRPHLIIADEPTGYLAPLLAKQVMNMFEQLHQSGTTVFIATHNTALIHPRYPCFELQQGTLTAGCR